MNRTVAAPAATPPGSNGSTAGITALTALAPLVWGTTYLVTSEFLPPGHPIFAGLMRSLVPGLVLLAIVRVLPHGIWWWRALALGVLNVGLFFPLLFFSAERLPGGAAASVNASQPLVVIVFAALLLGQRPTVARVLWATGGLIGVMLVVLGPEAALDRWGLLAGFGGISSVAVGMVLTQRWPRPAEVGPAAYTSWLLIGAGVVLLPLTFLVEGVPSNIDGAAIGGYLWLGIPGGILAYLVWFRGLPQLPITSAALLSLLSPIVAALLGWLVLDQTLRPVQILGFVLAMTSIVGGQLAGARSNRLPKQHESGASA